jgi:hypothetical protein
MLRLNALEWFSQGGAFQRRILSGENLLLSSGCVEDEAGFDEIVKKVAKALPPRQEEPKRRKGD